MTPDQQEAGSLKWERSGSVTIRQLSSGNFAMYHINGVGTPFWIGPAEKLLTAYANRPAPVVYKPVPTENKFTKLGINLANLEIDI